MDAQGWVTIISALSAAICSILAAGAAAMAFYKGHMAVVAATQVRTALIVADRKAVVAEKESKDRDTSIVDTLVEVKKEMNGHMAELLRVTGEAEHAKGVKEGSKEKETRP